MGQGETVPVPQLWDLAVAWYQERLDPYFHGRSGEQAQEIFKQVGLTSPFWSL